MRPVLLAQTSDQEVSLGQIAASQLADNGTSKPVNFEIDLQHCTMNTTKDSDSGEVTQTAPAVTVTFGVHPQWQVTTPGLVLPVRHPARVWSSRCIQQQNSSRGSTTARDLIEGDNTLGFSAYLQGLGDEVTTGEFTSIADFTLAYE